jgi:surfeit locus 1 family protein
MFADDAASARPQLDREPGEVSVTGIADSIPSGETGGTWRAIESDSVTLWSARRLALDSLRVRLPYALAPWVVHQLPGPGVPARPVRAAPAPLDESMHVSYAVQWFLFALILIAGPPIVMRSRRRARERPSDLEIPER